MIGLLFFTMHLKMRAYWIKETELTFGVIFLSRVSYMSKRYKKNLKEFKAT